LAELSLLDIPRLLVFNKIDLVPPAEASALQRARSDALFVCARNRETTRALLDRIAELLADRWAEAETYSHHVPLAEPSVEAPETTAEVEDVSGDATHDENSLTTLEEMLGSPRRQRRRSQVRV